MSRKSLELIPEGFQCVVRTAYSQLVPSGKVGSITHHGNWFDTGLPTDYLEANLRALRGDLPLPIDVWSEARDDSKDSWIHLNSQAKGEVIQSIVGDGALVPADSSLHQCVVWDNVRVPSGKYSRCIFHDGGVLKVDTKVTFIGMTEKAYKIRGTAIHGGVSGWVSPKALGSKDKDFVENFKKVYERQKVVRELIAKHEVAIGMSVEEVSTSLGRPTKTKVRQTVKGRTGVWEFIEYEEQDHYQAVRDPVTGRVFRQYSHTTKEETGKVVVEFENEVVTAIEESENNGGGRVKIVVPPLVFTW